MKKWIICVLSAYLLLGCKTVQHIDKSVSESKSEASTGIVSNINTNVTERTDNDKTKTIVITEYVTVYDTITKSYPVKSVTEIREDDKSKHVREDHSQRGDSVSVVEAEESRTQNDIVEETKDESGTRWRLFAFGVLVGVALVILVKLAWKYLKTQFTGGLSWILK